MHASFLYLALLGIAEGSPGTWLSALWQIGMNLLSAPCLSWWMLPGEGQCDPALPTSLMCSALINYPLIALWCHTLPSVFMLQFWSILICYYSVNYLLYVFSGSAIKERFNKLTAIITITIAGKFTRMVAQHIFLLARSGKLIYCCCVIHLQLRPHHILLSSYNFGLM